MRLSLLLALLCALAAPAAAQSAPDAMQANRYADFVIEGDVGEHRLIWRGQTIAEWDSFSKVEFVEVFPDAQNPRMIWIEAWNGAAVCGTQPIIVDISGAEPRVHDPIPECYGVDGIWTGEELLFENSEGGIWAYRAGADPVEFEHALDATRVWLGDEAFRRGERAIALRYLWPMRAMRWPEAALHIAQMLETGIGLPKDVTVALGYYLHSMGLGSAEAADAVAALYERGDGVTQDIATADAYRKTAANLRRTPIRDPFADPTSWKQWEGRYPFNRLLGRTLFEVDGVAARVRALAGADIYSALLDQTVMGKVYVAEDWLLAQGCMKHMCDEFRFSLFLNTVENGAAVLCIVTPTKDRKIRREVLAATGMGIRDASANRSDKTFLCDTWSSDIVEVIAPLKPDGVAPRAQSPYR